MNQQGKKLLLKLARVSIETRFSGEDHILKTLLTEAAHLHEKQGVFVTLHEDGELRGCIGIPEPLMPLNKAVVEASRSAAFDDPRFKPLSIDELKKIKIEISVLSVPKKLTLGKREEILKTIKVGKDGLIIRSRFTSGLLLPQVAVEYSWGADEFLKHLCLKAGLPDDAWKDPENEIYVFQADIFSE